MAGRFSVEAVFKGVDRITAPVTRMQNRVGKFTRSMTKGLGSVNSAVDRVIGSIARGSSSAVKGLAGVSAALGTVVTLFNKSSVEAEQLANSVMFNVDNLESIAGAVAPAGFQLDNVVDLIEEMNNKLGESAGLQDTITPVEESLAILGLRFKDIINLSPEKQFNTIANAALAMEDAQKAAAAADILLGGEANKIIGVLRQQGGTIEDIISQQKRLNFRTAESREGARNFAKQIGLVTRGASSLGAEISGLAGKHLAPLLEKLTDWAAANKKIIADNVVSAVTSIVDSVKFLAENMETIVKWTKRIGIGLGVFLAFSAILKTLTLVMAAVNLVMAANPIGLIVLGVTALIAAIAASIIWWDEIKSTILDFGRAVSEGAIRAMHNLKDVFSGLPGPIKAAISLLTAPIRLLIDAAAMVMDKWAPIKNFFAELWGGVVKSFDSAADKIASVIEKIGGLISGFFGAFSAVANGVGDFFAPGNVSAVANGVGDFFAPGNVSAVANGVGDFFAPGNVSAVANGVGDFFSPGEDDDMDATPAVDARPPVISPAERTARSIEEQRSTSTAEVTIKDDTGRAEVTGGTLGPGIKLQPTGTF